MRGWSATCEAITIEASAPEVSALAASAGSTFVRWVVTRNQMLGEPVLSGAIAASVEDRQRVRCDVRIARGDMGLFSSPLDDGALRRYL